MINKNTIWKESIDGCITKIVQINNGNYYISFENGIIYNLIVKNFNKILEANYEIFSFDILQNLIVILSPNNCFEIGMIQNNGYTTVTQNNINSLINNTNIGFIFEVKIYNHNNNYKLIFINDKGLFIIFTLDNQFKLNNMEYFSINNEISNFEIHPNGFFLILSQTPIKLVNLSFNNIVNGSYSQNFSPDRVDINDSFSPYIKYINESNELILFSNQKLISYVFDNNNKMALKFSISVNIHETINSIACYLNNDNINYFIIAGSTLYNIIGDSNIKKIPFSGGLSNNKEIIIFNMINSFYIIKGKELYKKINDKSFEIIEFTC